MKLTVTFDIDGKHKNTFNRSVTVDDLGNRASFRFFSTWVVDMLLSFFLETKNFLEREASQET